MVRKILDLQEERLLMGFRESFMRLRRERGWTQQMLADKIGISVGQDGFFLEAHPKLKPVDAAMNDLIRPTLYDAWHEVFPVKEAGPDSARMRADWGLVTWTIELPV